MEHHPLIIPSPRSIPSSLLNKDGSIPRQIFAPGLFQGSYSTHGLETILFKFKDENEIIGIKASNFVFSLVKYILKKIQFVYIIVYWIQIFRTVADNSISMVERSAVPLLEF